VVNFDLPNVPEDYVHRIGRTGRAGATGEAVSLVCVDEHQLLKDIERLIKRPIPQEVIAGFEPDLTQKPEPILRRSQGGGGARQGSPRQGAPKQANGGGRGPAKPAHGGGTGNGGGGNGSRSPKPVAAKTGGNGSAPRKPEGARPAGALLGGKPRTEGGGAGRRDTPRTGQRGR
jgi:ATP-dependent RNA helicase RhlE